MKTFDRKDVYSWSNCEEAKTYIGKTGYFNNDFESIKRAIELGGPAVLDRVDTNSIWCFKVLGVSLCFGLFLPADKVKDDGRRYREIDTHEEFIAVTGMDLGKILTIRLKDNPEIETSGILSSIVECKNKLQGVDIGGASYTMHDLFKRYEFYNVNDSEWAPFCLEVV